MTRLEDVTVFLVERGAEDRAACRDALRGYRLREFSDAEEALAATRVEHPACMVVEYEPPGLDGIQLVKQCRIAGYEGTVLMVARFGELDELVYSEQVNLIYRIVPKPIAAVQFRYQVDLSVADSRFRRTLEGRRRCPRFEAPVSVDAKIDGAWVSVQARNVSMGGLLLALEARVVGATALELRVWCDEGVVGGAARVVHEGVGGLGVEFVEPSRAFSHAVGTLVTHHRYARRDRRRRARPRLE